jgi:hypothetical protein
MAPAGIVEAIERMVEVLGPFLLALLLVGGPTACLVIYRLVSSRRARPWFSDVPDMYWRCLICNSMNRDADDACYRCRAARGVITLGSVTARAAAAPPAAAPPVAASTSAAADDRQPDRGTVGVPMMNEAGDVVGVPVMATPRPRRTTSSSAAEPGAKPADKAPTLRSSRRPAAKG